MDGKMPSHMHVHPRRCCGRVAPTKWRYECSTL